MKEAAITHSPHAFVPKRNMTQKERDALYRTRLDEEYTPYTVIDVLTKVYHRDFSADLLDYIGKHPDKFCDLPEGKGISRAWVNNMKIIRPESVFFQPSNDFRVDILIDTRFRLEEVQSGNSSLKMWVDISRQVRLRYSFDFIPCHLDCHFIGVVTDEKESLLELDPYHIPVDKYLLPVLKGNDDYRRLARYLMYVYRLSCRDRDAPFDPMEWLDAMHLTVRQGVFPDNGVLGEYFFSFGTADVLDAATGEVNKDSEINPGTIVINRDILDSVGKRNTTLTHEGLHHYFDQYYFMLQKTHGHQYCSYMCKRYGGRRGDDGRWAPVDIMEMQSSKLPGFMMIQDIPGKEHAAALLESYGGERNAANMKRLVADMAEYYKTTKTVAKTRLLDFGYVEVQGVLQSANGKPVPPYESKLRDGETYTIDESDGIREYIRNPEFRKIIDTGDYVYAEGHYCLNTLDYIRRDQSGVLHLTPRARKSMAECCLVFKREYKKSGFRIINGILEKNLGNGPSRVRYVKKDGTSPVTDEGRRRRAMIRKLKADQALVEKGFNQMTVELMEARKISIVPLAEATGLSRDTIKNMRNDPVRLFPIQEIVAVAIALHLPPDVSREYIRHAPTNFLDTEEMYCYRYALYNWYEWSVADVNRALVEMGVPPLTKRVAGYDENGVMMDDMEQYAMR